MTLCNRRLKVFKDSWFWRPGKFWPAAFETKLKASAAVIVPVGGNGLERLAAARSSVGDRLLKPLKPGRKNRPPPVCRCCWRREGSDCEASFAFLLQHIWIKGGLPCHRPHVFVRLAHELIIHRAIIAGTLINMRRFPSN